MNLYILLIFVEVEDPSLSAPFLEIHISGVKVLWFLLSLRYIGDCHKMVCKNQKLGNGNFLRVWGTCLVVFHDQQSAIFSFDLEVFHLGLSISREIEISFHVERDSLRTENKDEELFKRLYREHKHFNEEE